MLNHYVGSVAYDIEEVRSFFSLMAFNAFPSTFRSDAYLICTCTQHA